jgi:hypothetical protein
MGSNNSNITNTQVINVIGDANSVIMRTQDQFGNYMTPTAQPDNSGTPEAMQYNLGQVQKALLQLALGKFWGDYNYLWSTRATPQRVKAGSLVFSITQYAHLLPSDIANLPTFVSNIVNQFQLGAQDTNDMTTNITSNLVDVFGAPPGGVLTVSFPTHTAYTGSGQFPGQSGLIAQCDLEITYLNVSGSSGIETFMQVLGQQYLEQGFLSDGVPKQVNVHKPVITFQQPVAVRG